MDNFRATLISAEEVQGKHCIAFSGGQASRVLLDMYVSTVHRTRGKYAMPSVIHVKGCDASSDIDLESLREYYDECTFVERSIDDIVPLGNDATLSDCIGGLNSATAQIDLLRLYRDRLVVEIAQEQGCTAVLWGDSATRLAAKTLGLTAKGRGYALPYEVADHIKGTQGIWAVRPLKDLFNREITLYASLSNLSAPPRTIDNPRKAVSIDDLTTRYFDNLEESFPSLVATVVRTTNKLVEPVTGSAGSSFCVVCGIPWNVNAKEWLAHITVDEPPPGRARTLGTHNGTSDRDDLCYGCHVALRGTDPAVQWPTLLRREAVKDAVLKEFELRD